jgi:hypothetical protein
MEPLKVEELIEVHKNVSAYSANMADEKSFVTLRT